MNISPSWVVAIVIGSALYLAALSLADRALVGSTQVQFRYAAVIGTLALYFVGLTQLVDDQTRRADITKTMIAIVAAGCLFYEQHRAGQKRPVSDRWKKFVGITLGIAAVSAYFNGFKVGYDKFYHRHDQYHYYMGAKYFPELGYDRLYKCSAIAQDELGVVEFTTAGGGRGRLDMTKEVRRIDRKVRNLGGDNLLMGVSEVLDHPEVCKQHFTDPARWAAYKEDVKFFRLEADRNYWEGMQKDHGYNPPPVWTIAGNLFANMYPAGTRLLGFSWCQWISMLDPLLLAAMFGALWWAFGWRTFALGAVFWGCQASAPGLWTTGAFLRQDWLFFLVLSTCLVRKRWFKLAGAAMVYAGLLRVFPGLVVIGWLVTVGAYIWRHKKMSKVHQQMLLGGVLAAAVLIPVSLKISGKNVYQEFYKHTLEVHDRTPLTNHMGLRVLISHKFGTGPASGRMKYTQDEKLTDPFEVWKRMRNERYDKYRPVGYAITALSFLFFAWIVRRIKSTWIAGCLGQVFIILMSQLTSYYYAFMILTAPLAKAKKGLEVWIVGFAALTQFVFFSLPFNDDKYAVLTGLSLVFCYGLVGAFAPKGAFDRLIRRNKPEDEAEQPPAKAA